MPEKANFAKCAERSRWFVNARLFAESTTDGPPSAAEDQCALGADDDLSMPAPKIPRNPSVAARPLRRRCRAGPRFGAALRGLVKPPLGEPIRGAPRLRCR